MRRLKKLVKTFEFTEDKRSALTLGANVRLDPVNHRLELVATGGAYPTAPNLFARTWLSTPEAVKAWLLFQAHYVNKKNAANTIVTSVRFRLSANGTNDLFWNGSAWVAAGASDWNTEAEIAAHIATFPVAARSIQVVINLATTDPTYTPEVYWAKVLWEGDIEFQEDYIYRSLVRTLREHVRPIGEFAVASTGGVTFDLDAMESQYNFVGIDAVYDLTADPNGLVDLFQSYNPTTHVVTLSSAPAAGHKVLIRFTYEPEVAVTTDQEYTELAKLPAVVVYNVESGVSRGLTAHDSVIDRTTGAGWQLAGGYTLDLEFGLEIVANKAKDMTRIGDELKRFFGGNVLLRARGQDELYRLWLLDEFKQTTVPNQPGVHSGRLRARIANAVFYAADAVPVTGVLGVQVTGGNLEFSV